MTTRWICPRCRTTWGWFTRPNHVLEAQLQRCQDGTCSPCTCSRLSAASEEPPTLRRDAGPPCAAHPAFRDLEHWVGYLTVERRPDVVATDVERGEALGLRLQLVTWHDSIRAYRLYFSNEPPAIPS